MENKLNALYQYSTSLGEATTIEEISKKSLEIIKKSLGFTFISFQLVERDELVAIDYLDEKTPEEERTYLRLPINGKGVTTRVVREKQSILINNTKNDPDFFVGTGGNSLSELAVPIIIENKVVGVLNVENKKPNAFTLEDQHLLEIFAIHISAALERINRIDDLEQLVRKRTEEIRIIEKRYKDIIDVTGNQAWEYDFNTNKIWVSGSVVSPELGKEFTVNLEDYLNLQTASIVEEDRTRVNNEISYALSEKIAFNTEYRVKTSEGIRWYQVTSSVSKDEKGNPEKMLGISIDITEIKKMQEQLERQNIVLKELDDMKNRFISTISHELRTPITSFKGYLEIIDDKVDELPDDVQKYFEVLDRNTDRLITLTDDLLDQQRIQTGRLQISTEIVDITKILIDAINEIKVLTDQKDIRIETEIQTDIPIITADPVRIQQILVNLLHNAYKFSPDNTKIKTSIKKEQDKIHIVVSDNGIGLTEDQISLLFKPFPGIEHGMNIVGTGLGLSICRGLIELHGGKIWAESEGLEKGSSFHFILPVS